MKPLCFSFLLLLSCYCGAQKLVYNIYLFGSKIGQSVVERNIKSTEETDYTLNSASEAHIFFTTRKITLHYDIVFRNDFFFSSFSRHTRNDEVQLTTITRSGTGYAVKRDKDSFNLNGIINCSTIRLFYEEPCGTDHILSERLGEFRVIKKTAPGTYEAEMSDGITYIYKYKGGKLIELEMKKGLLGSIYLRLQQ